MKTFKKAILHYSVIFYFFANISLFFNLNKIQFWISFEDTINFQVVNATFIKQSPTIAFSLMSHLAYLSVLKGFVLTSSLIWCWIFYKVLWCWMWLGMLFRSNDVLNFYNGWFMLNEFRTWMTRWEIALTFMTHILQSLGLWYT